MKCVKCNNDYPSQYYFATGNVCKDCFEKMSPEEQEQLRNEMEAYFPEAQYSFRVGFGLRLGATFIDFVLITAIVIAVLFLTGVFNTYMPYLEDFAKDPRLIQDFMKEVTPISFIVTFMYTSLEILLAATPGKMILGIQIANEDRTRGSVSNLAMRYLIKHMNSILSLISFVTSVALLGTIGSFVFLIIVVGFFFTLAPKRQGFHDMAAQTAVFRRKDILEETLVQ